MAHHAGHPAAAASAPQVTVAKPAGPVARVYPLALPVVPVAGPALASIDVNACLLTDAPVAAGPGIA